jgi:hypothetical protein
MLHLGHTQNSNECFGAYGHEFTWQEMKWLVDWCFVRGVNLLYPHAFFYSTRGPRKNERPPDVGPNSPWWDDYAKFANFCRRVSWVNTGAQHVCQVAILGDDSRLPWSAAKICFQHQHDFNYLEFRHLWEDALVSPLGVNLRGMHYPAVILDGFDRCPPLAEEALMLLAQCGRLILWNTTPAALRKAGAAAPRTETELVNALNLLTQPDLVVDRPQPDLRIRHMVKEDLHIYLLANEGLETITPRVTIPIPGDRLLFDPYTLAAETLQGSSPIPIPPYTIKLLLCREDAAPQYC